MSLPHSFPLLSASPPHPLTPPKPGTSSYIFSVSFLTYTSLYSSTWLLLLCITAHCPSDKSLVSSFSYSSLWVTSSGSLSSFGVSFFLNPSDPEMMKRTLTIPIFRTSLSHKHSHKTSSQRFSSFSFCEVFWGTSIHPRSREIWGFCSVHFLTAC